MKKLFIVLMLPLAIYADSYSFGYATGSLIDNTFDGAKIRYNNTVDYISNSTDGWYDSTIDFFGDIATGTIDGVNNFIDGTSDGYRDTYY
jgi:hypothetical protein